MGNDSNLTGEIRIDPPLRWSQYRDLPLYLNDGGRHCLGLREELTDEQTDDGTVTIRRAVALVPRRPNESRRNYSHHQELTDFLAHVERFGDGAHRLLGGIVEYAIEDMETTAYRFRVEYPEPVDPRSTLVVDLIPEYPHVVRDEAHMVWPDGTRVEI